MLLENWFAVNKRLFPWREDPTPYRVWVSEVMLQQTRAQVVVSYFKRWMKQFTTIQELAAAPLELVIKTWEGLGYYSRARNLHAGAKIVMQEYNGQLPSTRDDLLKIPGVGSYTAGAILSFGFRQKAIAIDGNVARVVARYIWIDEDIGRASAKRKIETFVDQFLSAAQPWVTAEALIELGATVCTPVPHCQQCPLQHNCTAFIKGQPTALPIKAAGPKIEKITRAIAIIEHRGSVLVRKNRPGQLMADLWEFPYFENMQTIRIVQATITRWLHMPVEYVGRMNVVEHSFTRFCARLFPFRFCIEEAKDVDGLEWIPIEKLLGLPFSSGHRKIAEQISKAKSRALLRLHR